jgi:phosphatidylglycerophosphatase A
MQPADTETSSIKNKIVLIFATGFGLGFSPVAPGTAGAVLGLVITMLASHLKWIWQIIIYTGLIAITVPICGMAEQIFKQRDDRRIVADEICTFPLCALGLELAKRSWWFVAIVFVINRVMDIIKPPPARQAQGLSGGLGIVADDIFSSLYALLCNYIILRLIGG